MKLNCYYCYRVNYCICSIISDPDIKFDRRKPFARILNEGYINTERESLASIAKLSKIRYSVIVMNRLQCMYTLEH